VPITKRVADAIASQSSTEFTCFYMTDSFDMFMKEYPFAVQQDSWREEPEDKPPSPQPASTATAVSVAADDVEAPAHDDAAGVSAPAAAEFDLKGCPPM
jgi:hypothetical protein